MSKTGSATGSFFGNFIYDQLLRQRSQIERKFAEYIQFHGLNRARYWPWPRLVSRSLMVALVVKLKR